MEWKDRERRWKGEVQKIRKGRLGMRSKDCKGVIRNCGKIRRKKLRAEQRRGR